MTIRKTIVTDLAAVMGIYMEARELMRESGNPNQWHNSHPAQEIIEEDIRRGTSYVCIRDGEIIAVFYFNIEEDPTYYRIDGQWISNAQYGVVHRIARGRNGAGAGAFCLNWCFGRHSNIRIDTHKDNAPMRALLGKLGFEYCGIIWIASGDERLAFQKI